MAVVSAGRPAQTRFPVWGTQALVRTHSRGNLDRAAAQVRRVVDEFDLACSSFRSDSELGLLNRSRGEPVVVSGLLFSVVRAAIRAARLTGGAVDPTVGQALIAHRIIPRLHGNTASATGSQNVPAPGYACVRLDDASRTITLPPGVLLDLGVTAKALAVDIAAREAALAAGCAVLVALGADAAAAGGSPGRGWEVEIVDEDHRHGETVTLHTGALATSSVTLHREDPLPGTAHHLIDPVTGGPTSGRWRMASVIAASCLDANIASTAAIVLGAEARSWLQACALPARLVSHGGEVRPVSGWPATHAR